MAIRPPVALLERLCGTRAIVARLSRWRRVARMSASGGMQIGPGYDGRDTIRRWAGMGRESIARAALVTQATLARWESGHGGTELLRGFTEHDARDAVVRLANVYAALMWIGGACRSPSCPSDDRSPAPDLAIAEARRPSTTT